MSKVLLDTNVVLSGLLYRGKPFEILKLAEEGHIFLLTTPELFEEFHTVLHRKKFESRLRELRTSPEILLAKFATLVKVVSLDSSLELNPLEMPRDPADAVVVASAICARVDYLISADEDLTSLGEVRGIRILSPDKFLVVISS